MKRLLVMLISVLSVLAGFSACGANDPAVNNDNVQNNGEDKDTLSNQIKISIGSSTFTAALTDNAAVAKFKTMLPITVNMTELNGNEKYYRLQTSLPENASDPGTIHTGDLMLWGSNTLVLFYKTFSTSYSYTRLGYIKDTTGLAAAAGAVNVTVTFELE